MSNTARSPNRYLNNYYINIFILFNTVNWGNFGQQGNFGYPAGRGRENKENEGKKA